MIKNNLPRLMGEKRLKLIDLKRLSGLSDNTIRRIYYDTADSVSYNAINQICKVLDCSVGELFEYIPD